MFADCGHFGKKITKNDTISLSISAEFCKQIWIPVEKGWVEELQKYKPKDHQEFNV